MWEDFCHLELLPFGFGYRDERRSRIPFVFAGGTEPAILSKEHHRAHSLAVRAEVDRYGFRLGGSPRDAPRSPMQLGFLVARIELHSRVSIDKSLAKRFETFGSPVHSSRAPGLT